MSPPARVADPGIASLRPSREADLPALAAIYTPHALQGSGTFDLEAVDVAEMQRRRDDVLRQGWPWLVAEHLGKVVGYACASTFRARGGYRYCVEDAVYLAPGFTGRGIGRLLLAELIAQCEAAGARQMVALIGDSGNAASLGLHRALGFEWVGRLDSVGWKLGRWLDVVLMQRALGAGAHRPPELAR